MQFKGFTQNSNFHLCSTSFPKTYLPPQIRQYSGHKFYTSPFLQGSMNDWLCHPTLFFATWYEHFKDTLLGTNLTSPLPVGTCWVHDFPAFPCKVGYVIVPWRVRTWRIIPVSKWLVTPISQPFRPFGRGITPGTRMSQELSKWLVTGL